VEISTGRLAVRPIGRTTYFRYCILGIYERIHVEPPSWGYVRGRYELRDDSLIFHDQFDEGRPITGRKVFIRTRVGTQFVEPVHLLFSADVDSVRFEASEISSIPTASASVKQDSNNVSTLDISGARDVHFQSSLAIHFSIKNFIGVGTYSIKDKSTNTSASYVYHGDDFSVSWSSTMGTIRITEFDPQQKRCSGTFEFDAEGFSQGTKVKQIRNGTFSVPLYY
jgi:hypothetical protein